LVTLNFKQNTNLLDFSNDKSLAFYKKFVMADSKLIPRRYANTSDYIMKGTYVTHVMEYYDFGPTNIKNIRNLYVRRQSACVPN